jgi:hypothetical protein
VCSCCCTPTLLMDWSACWTVDTEAHKRSKQRTLLPSWAGGSATGLCALPPHQVHAGRSHLGSAGGMCGNDGDL